MQHTALKHLTALSIGALIAFSPQAVAQSATTKTTSILMHMTTRNLSPN